MVKGGIMSNFMRRFWIIGITLILVIATATTAFAKYDPPPVDPEPPTTGRVGP